jgi:NADH-quinone oxidoreductase subunit M
MGIIAATGTSFYMFRSYYMTFTGEYRGGHGHDGHGHDHGHGHTPHESPLSITLRAGGVGGGRGAGGILGIPTAWSGSAPILEHWLEPALPAIVKFAEASHSTEFLFQAIGVSAGVIGWFFARMLYKDNQSHVPAQLLERWKRAWTVVYNKYYVDELYQATVIRGSMGSGARAVLVRQVPGRRPRKPGWRRHARVRQYRRCHRPLPGRRRGQLWSRARRCRREASCAGCRPAAFKPIFTEHSWGPSPSCSSTSSSSDDDRGHALMISQQNVLSWATFFPLIGLAVILLFTAARYFLGMSRHALDQLARITGLVASGLSFGCSILAWVWFDPAKSGVQMMQHFTWIKSFNIEYLMGVDGLSISMVLLTGLISFVAFIASMPWWGGAKYSEMAGMTDHGGHGDHADHPKHFSVRMVPGYMCMLLLLQTGMMGTFVALDMFLFYVFWEVMLLPMYFLIGIWGGPRKEYAAIKFFLYTLIGSVLMLLAIIGIYYNSHAAPLADGTMSSGHTFNLLALATQGKQGVFAHSAAIFGFAFSKIAFIALFIGFAIKIPMFPFHTWLPDAHVEAPTPVSVILAGVLLKMGPYGILRFNYPLLPDATEWAANAIALFGVINIIYAAFVCLAQSDLKKLIAYSSVSHMGFTLLGMAAMTPAGISGAVFNMFSHGIISPMLFLIVGVIYDRAHHREIGRFGGLAVACPSTRPSPASPSSPRWACPACAASWPSSWCSRARSQPTCCSPPSRPPRSSSPRPTICGPFTAPSWAS